MTDNGKTTTATRTVIVRDSTAPTITLPKETKIHTNEVSGYDLLENVSVTDNYSSNITTTVNNTMSNLPGTYVITYTATDSSGNQAIERRIIVVE